MLPHAHCKPCLAQEALSWKWLEAGGVSDVSVFFLLFSAYPSETVCWAGWTYGQDWYSEIFGLLKQATLIQVIFTPVWQCLYIWTKINYVGPMKRKSWRMQESKTRSEKRSLLPGAAMPQNAKFSLDDALALTFLPWALMRTAAASPAPGPGWSQSPQQPWRKAICRDIKM